MSVDVEPIDIAKTDSDLARCCVTTVDATGTQRVYEVGVGAMTIGNGHVLAGKRVDPEPENPHRPPAPTDAAWSAAAEHFRERGYEVWRR